MMSRVRREALCLANAMIGLASSCPHRKRTCACSAHTAMMRAGRCLVSRNSASVIASGMRRAGIFGLHVTDDGPGHAAARALRAAEVRGNHQTNGCGDRDRGSHADLPVATDLGHQSQREPNRSTSSSVQCTKTRTCGRGRPKVRRAKAGFADDQAEKEKSPERLRRALEITGCSSARRADPDRHGVADYRTSPLAIRHSRFRDPPRRGGPPAYLSSSLTSNSASMTSSLLDSDGAPPLLPEGPAEAAPAALLACS